MHRHTFWDSIDFTNDSGEQSVHVLGVVSDEEKVVAKLEEVGLNALAHLPENGREGLGVLLVDTRGGRGGCWLS